MYELNTYLDGTNNGSGSYEDLHAALSAGNTALTGLSPIVVDEYEVTTEISGREQIVAYAYNDDAAEKAVEV